MDPLCLRSLLAKMSVENAFARPISSVTNVIIVKRNILVSQIAKPACAIQKVRRITFVMSNLDIAFANQLKLLVITVTSASRDTLDFQIARVSCTRHMRSSEPTQCLLECMCNTEGSVGDTCEDATGKCSCMPNIIGHKCDKCAPGFFGFPDCQGKPDKTRSNQI